MNILVTGANGQLGNEMQLVARTSRDHYIFTDVCDGYPTLDITDLDAVRQVVAEEKIGCIINCEAWTNVDKAEPAGDIVETLKAIAPENLARAMKEVGGLLVHVSTDYVFGADPYNTPCQETQTGTPTGVYGLTKLHGEEKIIATGVDHLIIRTAWLYSTFGNNFVKTMLRLGREKESLGVIFDQIGTPTYARDLAVAIFAVLTQDFVPGIYHFSNEGAISWYDFTKAIHRIAGITTSYVRPLHSEDYPAPAARPHYSVLDKTKIKETYHIDIPYWEDSLTECIQKLEQN